MEQVISPTLPLSNASRLLRRAQGWQLFRNQEVHPRRTSLGTHRSERAARIQETQSGVGGRPGARQEVRSGRKDKSRLRRERPGSVPEGKDWQLFTQVRFGSLQILETPHAVYFVFLVN